MKFWKRVKKKDKLRYLEVLAEAYPTPLSHTELAAKAGVSKPAVTRAKEALRDVCDLRYLTYDKFVFRADGAGAETIARTYYNNGRITRFLASKYVLSLVKKLGLHDQLSKQWRAYGSVFVKNDTDLMIECVMMNLAMLEEVQVIAKKLRSPSYYLQIHNLERLEPAFQKIRLPITDEASLERFLVIRDKWFALLRQGLSRAVCTLSILERLTGKERETYENVYKKTIEYYLIQVFESFTEGIAKSLEGAVHLRAEHFAIGKFYDSKGQLSL